LVDRYEFGNDFQEMILSTILRDEEIIASIRSVVDPDYFSDPTLRTICSKALEFSKKYRQIPGRKEFLEFCDDGSKESKVVRQRIKTLFKLEVKNTKYIRDQIISFAQFSAMKTAIIDSGGMVGNYDNHLKIKTLVTDALKVGISERDLGMNLVSGRQERYINRERRSMGGKYDHNKLSTGIARLDHVMFGGLAKGELGVLLGAQKGFKTGVLTNFGAAAVINRRKVLHITLEISEENSIIRYERRFSGLTRPEIISDYKRLDKSLRKIEVIGGGLFVKGFPTGSVTVEGIANYIQFLKSYGFIPDELIIDYGDLIRGSLAGREEKRHQLSQIYYDMRALAQENPAALWTASQVTRKAIGKQVIRKEDVAEAIDKISVCDIAIAICQTIEERENPRPTLRLFVAAYREGEEGSMHYCAVDYDRMRLREMDKEDYE
jgi:replicative DNA helicase